MDYQYLSFLLAGVMVVAISLELLTPTMGAFTLCATALGIGSVVAGFRVSTSFGYLMTGVNLALFPLSLWMVIRAMRGSPLVNSADMQGGIGTSPDAPALAVLLGREGRALTALRPGGAAMIDDMKVDVITQGKYLDAGTPIKVIQVEGNRVVVEAL
jgi:membrane-bound ClpP family serine protease